MKLYMRADGRSKFWQYDLVVDGERKRMSTGTSDKRKAMEVMKRALQEAPKKGRVVTLKDALDAYVTGLEADGKAWAGGAALIRDKTLGSGGFAGSGRFKLAPGLPLPDLTVNLLDKLRAARRAEGNSVQTIAHELKVIRSAVLRARRAGCASPDFKWDVPVAKAKTRWLSREEWMAVYAKLDPDREPVKRAPAVYAAMVQARDLFVALTLCGGRWGEVSRLTVDQVLPGNRINLYGYKTGKERIVPCPAGPMAEVIARRVAIARATGSAFLFPSRDAEGAQTTSGAITRAFAASGVNAPHIVERSGKATVHTLRHTFASWLLQDGMSLSEVQELLGHGSIVMTMRYTHLATGVSVSKAAAKLEAMFKAPETDNIINFPAMSAG